MIDCISSAIMYSSSYRHLFLILVVGFVAGCINNSYIVPDIMESRNLITAREMIEKGNWLVPTLNDEIRLEKPPLPTWIASISMMVAGDSWNAVRFIPGLMGILTLVYVYRLAKKLTGNATYALYSTLILGTCYNFILASRTVSWDIYCHAFMLYSIYHQYLLFTEGRHAWRNAMLAGVGLGLSILSKGPVSLYALWMPFLIAFVAIRFIAKDGQPERDNKRLILQSIFMILLGIAIGGAWYGYIWLSEPEAGITVLNKESGSWLNHNVRPWYYYATYFTETGIWIPVCILSLAVSFWQKRVFDSKHYLFAFIWMIASLVLLSCLPEKKNRYLLPLLIPAALTMGYLIVYWGKRGAKILYSVVGLFALIELFGMPLLAKYFSSAEYSSPKELVSRDYPSVPVYHSDKDTLRIELTYDLGRSIHPINLGDSLAVAKAKPFLLVTTAVSNDPDAPAMLHARQIGSYNANRHSKELKKDRQMFYYDLYFYE